MDFMDDILALKAKYELELQQATDQLDAQLHWRMDSLIGIVDAYKAKDKAKDQLQELIWKLNRAEKDAESKKHCCGDEDDDE